MKLTQITPYKYIVKVGEYTQYYLNNKMLQVKWGKNCKTSTLVDLASNRVIKKGKV